MAEPLDLLFDGERVSATVELLSTYDQVEQIRNAWNIEWNAHKSSCPRRTEWALGWGWADVLDDLDGKVFSLSAEGAGGRLGMVAVHRGVFDSSGAEALNLEYLAKSPRAFGIQVGRIAQCLVDYTIGLSIEAGLDGRVVIETALTCDSKTPDNHRDCPALLYKSMGFTVTEGDPYGVECVAMEISATDADTFRKRLRNGG